MQAPDKPRLATSDGDEVLIQLRENADQYAMKPPLQPQNMTQPSPQSDNRAPKKPMKFEEIKQYSSLQLTADGQSSSILVQCQTCNKKVQTVLTRKPGTQTYIAGCVLLFCSFGLVCLACLPCVMDDCKDLLHNCPDCKRPLGSKPFKIID